MQPGCSPAIRESGRNLPGRGELAADFVVQGEQVHGVPGLVNLYGIDSPGLTASLAIAERVSELLNRG